MHRRFGGAYFVRAPKINAMQQIDNPGGWEWDDTLYRGSARFYRRGRLPYAPGLGEALARALSLDGTGRLIDIGCGPGIIALELASLFDEVVGVDADADMLEEAAAEARRRGVTNARWFCSRAEQLPASLGGFRVATFAQSFHWMDRERVAETVRSMLDADGALVHINAFTRIGTPAERETVHPAPPYEAIAALVASYLGPERRAGQKVLADWKGPEGEDEIFLSARFAGPDVVVVPDGRVLTRTIDDVVASVYSVSFSAPHLFGSEIDAFETALRQLLANSSPEGLFSAQTGDNELRIWRPTRTR